MSPRMKKRLMLMIKNFQVRFVSVVKHFIFWHYDATWKGGALDFIETS